jgi:outer membrane protein OmpA-like peptidoglycan-associated protein
MPRRASLLLLAACLLLAAHPAVADEQPSLLNADQISFQLSRTKSLSLRRTATRAVLPGVTFEGSSARLTAAGQRQLDELAKAVDGPALRGRTFTVAEHTGILGSPGATQRLAERRAAAVRDYLVRRHGVDPGRVAVEGYGVPDPYGSTPSWGGGRVEIILGR